MKGLGAILFEETIYDPDNGKCLNNGTWHYKIPSTKDIPVDFRITFLDNNPNPSGILGCNFQIDFDSSVKNKTKFFFLAKAIGEPPIILSNSVYFALKDAIRAARADNNITDHFELEWPATVDKIALACMVKPGCFEF